VSLGVFDRFRRGGGPSRGVRQGRRDQRKADERTENIRVYQPGQGPPGPPPGGVDNPGRTVATPTHAPTRPAPSAPPTPMPDPPARTPPPSYTPDDPSDSEKTVYEVVGRSSKGKIVGVLVGVEGPCDGKLYAVFDGENTLGRGEQCRVVLSREDRRISREHAEVIHRDGVFVVRPLKDKAVTRVNDEDTEGSGLSHGDSLTLGDSTFRFLCVY
jgi:hypothetical protein